MLHTDNLKTLVKLFTDNGFEIRVVGGAVRDILLGETPKDIDLATTATPDQMIDMFVSNKIKYIPTGLDHGTITAGIGNDFFEITTLRIDIETDGRHAEVKFTTDWVSDAYRRDLTYNAMSMDFDGNIYDYFNGQKDLLNSVTKFVGHAENRIQEDYLRILRYFRFVGRQKDLKFDGNTLKIIKKNASGLRKISGERIWSEMQKIIGGVNAPEILLEMAWSNVGFNIDLDIKNLNKVDELKEFDVRLILAAMLDDVFEVEKLYNSWKFDKLTYNLLKFIVKNKHKKIDLLEAKKMILIDEIDNKTVRQLAHFQGNAGIANELKTWKPNFPVNGKDLINAGFETGFQMGVDLKEMKTCWLHHGEELTKEELINGLC